MALPSSEIKDGLQSFLSFLNQQASAPRIGTTSGKGADLDSEAVADLIWLAVHQPSNSWAKYRNGSTGPTPDQTKKTEPSHRASFQDQEPNESETVNSIPNITVSSAEKPVEAVPSLQAQLLPQASVPGSERLPVWVNEPLDLIDPQKLFEAVLPLMQSVAAEQAAGLDEPATLDHYVQWRQLIPVWQPDQQYRFTLTLILDQGFSMTVWQPRLEHISERLGGFHGFKDVKVLHWFHGSTRSQRDEGPEAISTQQLEPSLYGPRDDAAQSLGESVDRLTVVITDCAGPQWWGTASAGLGPAFAMLKRLGAAQPLVIWQVLPSWMWSRTALGKGKATTLRRSAAGADWPFQRAGSEMRQLTASADAQHPLPVFELTEMGLRSWGSLLSGSPFIECFGFLLPAEPRVVLPDSEIAARQGQQEDQDPLMPLRRFQHLASLDARRLMALFAAAPVLTLPVMRLIQAALLEDTGTAALAEVVLSGLLRPLNRNQASNPEALQFTFAEPIRAALLRQQPANITLQVIEEVTDFIAAHWSTKGWGSFRAFLTDPAIAAPPGQEQSQHFANLAADIIASLGGAYATFAERLRIAQRKEPWPRNLFHFEPVESEVAQLLMMPELDLMVFTTVSELEMEPLKFSFPFATAGGKLNHGNAKGYREALKDDVAPLTGQRSASANAAHGTFLPMLHIPAGRFLMGSPADEPGRYGDEGPQHWVQLDEFFLSQTPITQAQWRAVAQWQRREDEDGELWPEVLDADPVAKLDNAQRFAGEQRPVVNVSWHDAMVFCQRLRLRTGKNYTLPSESQWEYACRAGTTTPFHFGDTISTKLANYDGSELYGGGQKGEYRQQTTDVASFPANPWGLHDMHGNVWEWCADHWHYNYKGAPEEGRDWINEEAKDNKNSSNRRLLRGGSWGLTPRSCRSAYRDFNHPDFRYNGLGFRVCCLPQDLFFTL